MYGLIGKIGAVKDKGDELTQILLTGTQNMVGNLSYVVAIDAENPDLLWVTEVWTDQQAHLDSLKLPEVQHAITKGRPLIATMERVAETRPLGGHNL